MRREPSARAGRRMSCGLGGFFGTVRFKRGMWRWGRACTKGSRVGDFVVDGGGGEGERSVERIRVRIFSTGGGIGGERFAVSWVR